MKENIKKQSVDVDEWIKNDTEAVIKFIHDQYQIAANQLNSQSQS